MASIIGDEDLEAYLHRPLLPEEADLALIATDSASEVVRDYCHQDFTAATNQTVILDGTGTQWLLLPQTPVNAVDSVQVDYGLSSVDTLTEGQDDEYLWYADGRLFRVGTTWPSDPQSVAVQYDYGYATIPASVRMVALQVAARIFSQGLVRQESVGGYSATYASADMGGLAPAEERVLSRYRLKGA